MALELELAEEDFDLAFDVEEAFFGPLGLPFGHPAFPLTGAAGAGVGLEGLTDGIEFGPREIGLDLGLAED